MKGTSIIVILMMTITFCGFSQEESEADSTTFETLCDCLEAEYLFKKEFMENLSEVEGKIRLSKAFIEKYDFSWEKLKTIHARCYQITYSRIEEEPCSFEQKITELNPDFELVLRVIKMNGIPHNY
ncbi:MAG: hypothetical protein P8P74_18035 [Crocinitomicaceae bacterium]|nr:hypothetical protein [Crocinitomicaceae bacterium]